MFLSSTADVFLDLPVRGVLLSTPVVSFFLRRFQMVVLAIDRTPKIYAAPHRLSVQVCSRNHCTVWRSVQYSALSMCILLSYAHAHRKSIVRSNNALTGNFYVVYLFLFAVALLCWTTLVKSPSLICSHSALLTCADNIALPGFLYVYLMFLYTESSFLFIFHWFTRSNEH